MAHFVYFVGYTNPIPDGHVPDSTEYTLLWDQLVAAINGDGGGTYAPSAFITVGGSGFQLTGTGHELAASARFTVQPGAEIRLPDTSSSSTLPILRVNGSSGDILLFVKSHISTLQATNGSLIRIDAGAALDIYGAATFKNTSGPGSATWEANATATFASGAAATFQSGSTFTLAAGATAQLSGSVNLNSSSQLLAKNGSIVIFQAGSSTSVAGSVSLTGAVSFDSGTWPLLDSRTWHRPGRITVPLAYESTPPASPAIWSDVSDMAGAPCWKTSTRTAAGGQSIIEFTDLPIGGTITSVTITTKGTNGASVGATMPTYQIVSWSDSSIAALTGHSLLTTDGGSAATFSATTHQTTVAATGSPTVPGGAHYGLLVNHPYETAVGQGMRIYEITMNGTAASVQL